MEAEGTIAREARGRADALHARLEEKAATLDTTSADLAAANASLVGRAQGPVCIIVHHIRET